MKCETAQQVFSEYFQESIEKPLALMFEKHLEQCEECRRAYAKFRSTWHVLEQFPAVEPPASFRENLLARVRIQQETAHGKASAWCVSWRDVIGARVPAKVFAWALSALIVAVLLVKVSPGVFQSTLSGPFGVSQVIPAGPGMDVRVRASDPGANVYMIVLNPLAGCDQIEAVVHYVNIAKQSKRFHIHVFSGSKIMLPIPVEQPRWVTDPAPVTVRWIFAGAPYAKRIYLPRGQMISTRSRTTEWRGSAQDALRRLSANYGVAISFDDALRGHVKLSGKFDSAKDALNQMAEQLGLRVTTEGPRAFNLQPR